MKKGKEERKEEKWWKNCNGSVNVMAVSIGWKSLVIGITANSIKALLHRCTIRVSSKNKHSYKKRNARNIDASKSLHFRRAQDLFQLLPSENRRELIESFFSSFTHETNSLSRLLYDTILTAIASSPINFKIESNIFLSSFLLCNRRVTNSIG